MKKSPRITGTIIKVAKNHFIESPALGTPKKNPSYNNVFKLLREG